MDVTSEGSNQDGGGEDQQQQQQAPQFTVEDILAKAEEFVVTCNYEMADLFYKKALECLPDTVPILEDYSNLLLEMNELERALEVLNRIIELEPNGSSIAFLNLAQLKVEQEAIDYYLKGIQVLQTQLASAHEQGEEDMASPQSVTRQISNAYCAIAEIYLTDSCFAEDAESQCEYYVNQAMLADNTNPEAYHVAASLRISQQRNADALEVLQQGYLLWKDLDSGEKPLYQARINTSKLFIELNQLPQAIAILDELILENDQELEPWHLLAICHSADDTYAAEECLQKAIEIARCENDDILPQLEFELDEIQQRNAAKDELRAQEEGNDQEDEGEEGEEDEEDDEDEPDSDS